MGSVVVLLAIIGMLVLFAYLKFPPLYAKKKLVNVYDMMVLGVCAFICLMWILNIRSELIDTSDESEWQPLAIAGAPLMLIICAAAAGFIPARRAASIEPMQALRTE